MTNSDNPFLHAKKLWKKVYKCVFFQDSSIAEKEQKNPSRTSQNKEQQHETTQTSEVGSHEEYDKFMDWTGFGDVRRNLLYYLTHVQHETMAWHYKIIFLK